MSMNTYAHLLQQRSYGQVSLRIEGRGVANLRETGAAKLRIPAGSHQAILINTGGGLAGGDHFEFDFQLGQNAKLTLTSQSAERVYRTLGPPAKIETHLLAEAGSILSWLPQETILFDGASLQRNYTVALAENTRFLAVEPVVLGRSERGEKIETLTLQDSWRIFQADKLLHAENLQLTAPLPRTKAAIGSAGAFASVVYIATDAHRYLDAVRAALGQDGAASAWNGKLVARLLAKDGFHLRKRLIPALWAIIGSENLPKSWTS